MAMLLSLALAVSVFSWFLAPLFGPSAQIAQARGEDELSLALNRSLRELETDLGLGKIHPEDLAAIQQHLEKESGA